MADTRKDAVGVVGVGAMGAALLENIIRTGARVYACDVSDRARAVAAQIGAIILETPGDIAREVRRIHVFVNTDSQTLDVARGRDGFLEAAAPGSVIFLHSTILPSTTLRIGRAAQDRGLRVYDAPITATPPRVRKGEGIALVGGDPEGLDEEIAYLASLALKVEYFGRSGAGNAAKIGKNLLNAAERLALIATVGLVEQYGLNYRQFLNMVRAADYGSLVGRWEHIFNADGERAVARRVTNLFNKDVALAAELADAIGFESGVVRAAAAAAADIVAQWKREDNNSPQAKKREA